MKNLVIFFYFREQIKEVPVKLDNFLASKHYLHATDLIVNAGKITDHSTVTLVQTITLYSAITCPTSP